MGLFQSASSPRRVAVPVLVKDGKPCGSGGGNEGGRGGNPSASLASPAPHMGGNNNNPHAGLSSAGVANNHHGGSVAHHGMSHVMTGGQGLQHCSYSRSAVASNQQAVQAAMQQHQQQAAAAQCGAYLPLQGRAW